MADGASLAGRHGDSLVQKVLLLRDTLCPVILSMSQFIYIRKPYNVQVRERVSTNSELESPFRIEPGSFVLCANLASSELGRRGFLDLGAVSLGL
jgi:hypothetical protein